MTRVWGLVALGLMVGGAGVARADLVYSNGTVNTFAGSEPGNVIVLDNPSPPPGPATTLNVVSPATIGGNLSNFLGPGVVNFYGASIGGSVANFGTGSVVNILGGSVGGQVANFGTGSVVNILGGSVGGQVANFGTGSVVNILGGSLAGPVLNFGTNSVIEFFGVDFKLDGVDVPYGTLAGTFFGKALTGMLHDGSPIAVSLSNFGPSSSIVLTEAPIPEPSSLALLGLGGAALAGWRWRRRKALA